MGSLVLTVGTGSTWAMRAALVLAMSGLEWQEQVFDLEDAKELQRLKRLAPAGLVPWLDHDGVRIHDSLAIAEYLHELCPARRLYPEARAERALARSLCAELHAGFRQIRTLLPFFLGAPTRSEPPVEAIGELARLQIIWSQARGPFYFGDAGILDAFYAVMAYRLASYGIQLPGQAGAYQQALLAWPLWQQTLVKARLQWPAAARQPQ
ncbi:glutathione S-transferase N-terminal domain-containing protein [Aeromonas hydrophila]|uniref:glutathione S-transferase N-terminal domain-containing protein n=1 Tax=Aeromonas hydrophila TaxID=644 RepID=UPI0019151544|nr:glutathione S-transferase N-terminal domain-containing protein [Aeromonas hydrophila]MBQ4675848.1 glutathione S-transferase [Aeromonas hydrophila]MBW3814393.1 glutathione S-transferase [Aeromonas hydrophila]MCF7680908.1 glutathione S-transferase N-terminal domain-containing protein [Aeromonas hydrophila]MCF7693816.1 glutathione S-transferase N-terminal domain-containing protein [Aeromonas hydrophila]MCF7774687.1 glutathione S-transferase N-terminal domain-containing protein [Aeromonas hydro